MDARLLLLAAALLLPACGKLFPPKKWEESIARASEAWDAGEYAKVVDFCARAAGQAIDARDPAKGLEALECTAEAAWREGAPVRGIDTYLAVRGAFPTEFRSWIGRHRLRNNAGIALLSAGRREDAIKEIEEGLDAYEGTPWHSSGDYRARMLMVANLGAIAIADADGTLGVRLSTEILEELRIRMVRYERMPEMLQGVGAALDPIAEITRLRGDPQEAAEIAATAKDLREAAGEDAGKAARICNRFVIRTLALESCMRSAADAAPK